MPEFCRHQLKPGECYLEWIGTTDAARGKGAGSKLLKWAEEIALEHGCAVISLDVVPSNPAVGIYEKKGYVGIEAGSACARPFDCLFIFCFMGCRYTSVMRMEKPLTAH